METNILESTIDKLSIQSKEIQKAELDTFLENDKIVTWIIGLSTGGFILALSRLSKENIQDTFCILIITIVVYILILICGLIEKIGTKSVRRLSGLINVQYDIMGIGLKINPQPVINDLEKDTIFKIHYNFMDGKYCIGDNNSSLKTLEQQYKNSHIIAGIAFLAIMFLFLLQYGLLIAFVIKSI